MKVIISDFGKTSSGDAISLYHIENSSGAYLEISDFGARLVKIVVPDKSGKMTDVILGLSSGEQYEKETDYLGAVCGRCANRIKGGHFTLNNQEYQLAVNNGSSHLHGGVTGYSHKMWKAQIKEEKLVLTMHSLDGDEHYPGSLTLTVTYGWTEDNELSILYEAYTDQDTILNVTSHCYFNLNGEGSDSILNHELFIDADAITELDDEKTPTGVILPVEGTPFDFRTLHTIGKFLDCDHSQLTKFGTYDHNFIINGEGLREAAVLQSKESGIRMTCFTDQPGMQIYIPASPTAISGKSGRPYPAKSSICMETQHFPDAVNHENFPSTVLPAGESFRSKTLYHFSTFHLPDA